MTQDIRPISQEPKAILPPLQVVVGLFQLGGGFAVGFVAIGLRMIPILSPFGGMILGGAHQLSYHGGRSLARGLSGTVGMGYRAVKNLVSRRQLAKRKMTET